MAKKILNTLTNNLPFKILAVGLAFVLWLVVYNIDDPKITQTFTTNVTIENVSVVAEQNKCYEVLEGTNTVTFAVTAKRSIMKNLEDADFRAVADLNRMVMNEDGKTADVPIEISSTRSNNSLNYPNKKYLKLALEDLMSKRLVITATTSGKVADGYALGDVAVTNPNVLKISGPASIVSTIASAVATIDVEGMSVNLSDNVVPVLYDADGNEIDTTRLTFSNTTVAVSAKILLVNELPLVFSTVGTPGGDYNVVGITSDPAMIRVKGAASALNPLTCITIPGDLFDVSGAREDISTTIDITEFLPEGVELVDVSDAKVAVTVRIEAYKTQRFALDTSGFTVEGLESGHQITFTDDTVYVSVSALQSNLNRLSSYNIIGKIDVTGLSEGTHQVVLFLELDEENYAYQPVTVEVTITRESEEDPTEGSEDSENNNSGDMDDVGLPGEEDNNNE